MQNYIHTHTICTHWTIHRQVLMYGIIIIELTEFLVNYFVFVFLLLHTYVFICERKRNFQQFFFFFSFNSSSMYFQMTLENSMSHIFLAYHTNIASRKDVFPDPSSTTYIQIFIFTYRYIVNVCLVFSHSFYTIKDFN